jgi:hypothetical protein
MTQTVNFIVCGEDRERLHAIIGDQNRPLKHIHRAKIVLFPAERLPVLEDAPHRAEKPASGYLRWRGDDVARDAVYANRARLKSGVGRDAMRRRGEMLERSFAHVLHRGGMRRAWLRGRENVHKRYLIHVAGFNLGILMCALFGCGTPREAARVKNTLLFLIQPDGAVAFAIIAEVDGEKAMLVILVAPEPD